MLHTPIMDDCALKTEVFWNIWNEQTVVNQQTSVDNKGFDTS
jgi:hypothetical protein